MRSNLNCLLCRLKNASAELCRVRFTQLQRGEGVRESTIVAAATNGDLEEDLGDLDLDDLLGDLGDEAGHIENTVTGTAASNPVLSSSLPRNVNCEEGARDSTVAALPQSSLSATNAAVSKIAALADVSKAGLINDASAFDFDADAALEQANAEMQATIDAALRGHGRRGTSQLGGTSTVESQPAAGPAFIPEPVYDSQTAGAARRDAQTAMFERVLSALGGPLDQVASDRIPVPAAQPRPRAHLADADELEQGSLSISNQQSSDDADYEADAASDGEDLIAAATATFFSSTVAGRKQQKRQGLAVAGGGDDHHRATGTGDDDGSGNNSIMSDESDSIIASTIAGASEFGSGDAAEEALGAAWDALLADVVLPTTSSDRATSKPGTAAGSIKTGGDDSSALAEVLAFLGKAKPSVPASAQKHASKQQSHRQQQAPVEKPTTTQPPAAAVDERTLVAAATAAVLTNVQSKVMADKAASLPTGLPKDAAPSHTASVPSPASAAVPLLPASPPTSPLRPGAAGAGSGEFASPDRSRSGSWSSTGVGEAAASGSVIHPGMMSPQGSNAASIPLPLPFSTSSAPSSSVAPTATTSLAGAGAGRARRGRALMHPAAAAGGRGRAFDRYAAGGGAGADDSDTGDAGEQNDSSEDDEEEVDWRAQRAKLKAGAAAAPPAVPTAAGSALEASNAASGSAGSGPQSSRRSDSDDAAELMQLLKAGREAAIAMQRHRPSDNRDEADDDGDAADGDADTGIRGLDELSFMAEQAAAAAAAAAALEHFQRMSIGRSGGDGTDDDSIDYKPRGSARQWVTAPANSALAPNHSQKGSAEKLPEPKLTPKKAITASASTVAASGASKDSGSSGRGPADVASAASPAPANTEGDAGEGADEDEEDTGFSTRAVRRIAAQSVKLASAGAGSNAAAGAAPGAASPAAGARTRTHVGSEAEEAMPSSLPWRVPIDAPLPGSKAAIELSKQKDKAREKRRKSIEAGVERAAADFAALQAAIAEGGAPAVVTQPHHGDVIEEITTPGARLAASMLSTASSTAPASVAHEMHHLHEVPSSVLRSGVLPTSMGPGSAPLSEVQRERVLHGHSPSK